MAIASTINACACAIALRDGRHPPWAIVEAWSEEVVAGSFREFVAANLLAARRSWSPGGVCGVERLHCSAYYPRLDEPEGRKAVAGDPPEELRELAGMVAAPRWTPDPVFVVDVCETRDAPRVLELNGFSCSDLFACDMDEVVAIADEL